MKILMLTSRMDIGGAESHILTLCQELSSLGHEVFCASSGGALSRKLEASGTKHTILPLDRKDPVSVVRSFRLIRRIIKEEQIDIVHSHSRIPALLTFWIKKTQKKPFFAFVCTAHLPFSSHPLFRRASKWGDECIAVSNDIRTHISKEYGLEKHKITVIENGIDQRAFSRSDKKRAEVRSSLGVKDDEIIIATSHRSALSRSASSLYLCKNADKLLGGGEHLLILLSGKVGRERDVSSEIEDEAKKQNEKLGRKAITVLRGESDISGYLSAADVFVGVSRSAAEAMSASLPVIIAGNEGYGGILSEKNAERLAKANLTARGERLGFDALETDLKTLKNEEIRKSSGDFSLCFSQKRYSSAKMAEKTLEVYNRAISKEKKPRLLFIGHYGALNLGDDAISDVISERFGEKYSLGFLCRKKSAYPDGTAKKMISRLDLRSIRIFSNGAAGVILGGGNLLQDDTSLRSALYYKYVFSIASKKAKASAVFANGIGPLHTSFAKKLSADVLRGADLISMRDPVSVSDAAVLSGREDVRLGADPAYLIPTPTEDEIKSSRFYRAFGKDGFVCVCPRSSMGKSEKKALVQVLRHLSNDGVHALFLPFAEEDIRICSELSESVAGSVSLTCVPTAKEASLAISCSRGCIGARLHSAILSLVCKRAFVGFDSDGRILRINGHAGTGEYVPASKLSEKALLDAWAAAQKFDVSLADEALLRMRSLASGELDTLQTFFEKRSKENQG